MLPWLFAVLLALNAALFYWGYQRELSRAPVPPELPKAEYSISLLPEVRSGGTYEKAAGQRMDQPPAPTRKLVQSEGKPGSAGPPREVEPDGGVAGTEPAADPDAVASPTPPTGISRTNTTGPDPRGNGQPELPSASTAAVGSDSAPAAAEPNPVDGPTAEVTDPAGNADQPEEAAGTPPAD
jgi:hypothetical protein